jgi:hypothetical protein
LEQNEPFAYGALELKPWEFGRLQPHEFYAMLEGYNWRKERQEEMTAYFVCGLMNMSGKSFKKGQSMSVKDLLKPLRQPAKRSKKEDEQYLREQFNLRGGE